jgi:hypothetical protein
VLSYAAVHLDFPHESTVNQFFTKSQFESYRALGYETAYKMLCYAGYCVSNYGRASSCPYWYHLGWNVHACVANR